MSQQPSAKALKMLESLKEAVAQELEKNVDWDTTLYSGKTARLSVSEMMLQWIMCQKKAMSNIILL